MSTYSNHSSNISHTTYSHLQSMLHPYSQTPTLLLMLPILPKTSPRNPPHPIRPLLSHHLNQYCHNTATFSSPTPPSYLPATHHTHSHSPHFHSLPIPPSLPHPPSPPQPPVKHTTPEIRRTPSPIATHPIILAPLPPIPLIPTSQLLLNLPHLHHTLLCYPTTSIHRPLLTLPLIYPPITPYPHLLHILRLYRRQSVTPCTNDYLSTRISTSQPLSPYPSTPP